MKTFSSSYIQNILQANLLASLTGRGPALDGEVVFLLELPLPEQLEVDIAAADFEIALFQLSGGLAVVQEGQDMGYGPLGVLGPGGEHHVHVAHGEDGELDHGLGHAVGQERLLLRNIHGVGLIADVQGLQVQGERRAEGGVDQVELGLAQRRGVAAHFPQRRRNVGQNPTGTSPVKGLAVYVAIGIDLNAAHGSKVGHHQGHVSIGVVAAAGHKASQLSQIVLALGVEEASEGSTRMRSYSIG